jgi:cytochrome c5
MSTSTRQLLAILLTALAAVAAIGAEPQAREAPAPASGSAPAPGRQAAAPARGAAGAADWANPGGSAVQARGAATPAEALFVEKCSMCHREMGMGTVILARRVGPALAMLEKRTDLSPLLIETFVRTGGGNMPRITRGEVSDEQLAAIVSHLVKAPR